MSDFEATSTSVGALPQTPLGELTVLPRPPSWILRGSTSVETMNTQKWIVWAAESLKISILFASKGYVA